MESIAPLGHGAAESEGSPFTPQDLARFPVIVGADLAPDASSVVYTASTRDGYTAIEKTLLWQTAVESGGSRLLIDSEGSQSRPSISPSGRDVAFLQEVHGRNQLAVLNLTDLSMRVLTNFARGVGSVTPAWSPDGDRLAFAASDEPLRDPFRPYRVRGRVWRQDGLGLISDVSAGVWTIESRGGSATRLTGQIGVVTDIAWSPSGSRILYGCFAEGGSTRFVLRTIDRNGNDPRIVVDEFHYLLPVLAQWLPDGRIVRTTAWDSSSSIDLIVHDPHTRSDLRLDVSERGQLLGIVVPGMARQAFEAKLVVDESGDVLVPVQVAGRIEIHRVRLAGADHEIVLTGDFVALPVAARGGEILAITSSFREPARLVLIAQKDEPIKALDSCLDYAWLEQRPFEVHELNVSSVDGTHIDAWYLAPVNTSRPYPTVLSIHGGPFAASGHVFSVDHHLLTAAGYGVLLVNYRGSSGYGPAFAQSIVGDWGLGARDLIAAVDHSIALGLADSANVAAFGLSAGGYYTAWLLSHSDLFRVGISECPVTDWTGMVGSDIPDLVHRWMDVDVGQGLDAGIRYAQNSPVTFAAAYRAPVLLIEHEGDLRCPAGQGDSLYNALLSAGRIAEMLRLPGMSHGGVFGVGGTSARIERLEAIVDWLATHMPATGTDP